MFMWSQISIILSKCSRRLIFVRLYLSLWSVCCRLHEIWKLVCIYLGTRMKYVVFHRKSMIFHSVFSLLRICLCVAELVYWRIKTQLQEHARKSTSFSLWWVELMCSQFFNHMIARGMKRNRWKWCNQVFRLRFLMSLVTWRRERKKCTQTYTSFAAVDGFYCRFFVSFTSSIYIYVQCTYTAYRIWDMSVYAHKYMSIPQHLTPLPLKPFKLDKMLYSIDISKLVSCMIVLTTLRRSWFSICCWCVFFCVARFRRYVVVAVVWVIEAAF